MLANMVASKFQLQWPPEQVAGWLKQLFTGYEYQVSYETVYRSLSIQVRGALKKELLEHSRRARATRRSRHHTQKTDNHAKLSMQRENARIFVNDIHVI